MIFKILMGIILLGLAGAIWLAGVIYGQNSCQWRGLTERRIIDPNPPSFSELLKKFPEVKITTSSPVLTRHGWFYQKLDFEIYSVYGGPANNIRAEWWRPIKGQHRKVVMVLPITGSGDPGGYIAWYLVNWGGYDVLRIRGGDRRFLEAESADNLTAVWEKLGNVGYYMQVRLINYWRVVDWLKRERGYEMVNVVGVSLGAIEGAILALHPEVRRAVLALGGGGLAEILLSSEEPFVRTWRKTLQEQIRPLLERERSLPLRAGQSAIPVRVEEVAKLMAVMLEKTFFETEPLRHAPGLEPQKILMINARDDRTIPLGNVMKLWLAANQPRLILLPVSHVGMAWYTPVILYHISQFFKQDY